MYQPTNRGCRCGSHSCQAQCASSQASETEDCLIFSLGKQQSEQQLSSLCVQLDIGQVKLSHRAPFSSRLLLAGQATSFACYMAGFMHRLAHIRPRKLAPFDCDAPITVSHQGCKPAAAATMTADSASRSSGLGSQRSSRALLLVQAATVPSYATL